MNQVKQDRLVLMDHVGHPVFRDQQGRVEFVDVLERKVLKVLKVHRV